MRSTNGRVIAHLLMLMFMAITFVGFELWWVYYLFTGDMPMYGKLCITGATFVLLGIAAVATSDIE